MSTTEKAGIFEIEQIRRLPRHLKQYIVEQDYDRYTPVDQAVWRTIMRQAFSFHRSNAHPAYVEGLRQTGIGLERIPRIEEMNQILGRIGWGAASVDGFIPPAAFMEFQAHRVLVIAADIRQIDHLEYTPAPDIVHEAAGHAPIIADPEYAEYLRRFGEYGALAISSRADFELYEAIRHLSILKEAPGTPPAEIEAAQAAVAEKQASLGEPSEMALLSRLHWWTVEYGLIGTCEEPKLYGAGLLSSIGEAAHCLTDAVRKLPYTIEAAEVPFDITKMQPQLFVTPDFPHLTAVLEEFAATMAFRRGGRNGLEKGLRAGSLCSYQLSSGLQVSGVISEVLLDSPGQPAYVRTSGPTALACGRRQLGGHDKGRHPDGFGAPVGGLLTLQGGTQTPHPLGAAGGRAPERPLEQMDEAALWAHGVARGEEVCFRYESGVEVRGTLRELRFHDGRLILLTLDPCRVTLGERVLFQPEWGCYDLAVGEEVVSVFQGAADPEAYAFIPLVPRERTIKVRIEESARPLHRLYQDVRRIRETGLGAEELPAVLAVLERNYPEEWLLRLEILELLEARDADPPLRLQLRRSLESMAAAREDLRKLIRGGLDLLAV